MCNSPQLLCPFLSSQALNQSRKHKARELQRIPKQKQVRNKDNMSGNQGKMGQADAARIQSSEVSIEPQRPSIFLALTDLLRRPKAATIPVLLPGLKPPETETPMPALEVEMPDRRAPVDRRSRLLAAKLRWTGGD
jgi:hypothetical protein